MPKTAPKRKKPAKPVAKPKAPADQWLRDIVQKALDRQDHGPTDAARGSGVPRTTIVRWLNGTRNIRVQELAKLLTYLQIRVMPYGSMP